MSDKSTELYEAAQAILQYLKASTDHRDLLRKIRTDSREEIMKATKAAHEREDISPADRLRQEADELEARDSAIARLQGRRRGILARRRLAGSG